MLGDELLRMLRKGFTLQYRQPSADSRPSMTLYESPIPRSRTFSERDINEQDLWGGARNAEFEAKAVEMLRAWAEKAEEA